MPEYENLRMRLVEKTSFTVEQIEQLVQHKRERIGSGYLTKQGALFLIASDFGILLTEELEEEISPIQTITIELLHIAMSILV